jgi:hypothetical protein
MSIKQISVFLENKPGMLENMTSLLAENKIDIRALSLAEAEEFGIVRIIVNDVYDTMTVLKDHDFVCKITPVVAVAIPDEPGGLDNVLKALKKHEINIKYMYAFLDAYDKDKAYMIFKVEDEQAAAGALKKENIKVIDEEDIFKD